MKKNPALKVFIHRKDESYFFIFSKKVKIKQLRNVMQSDFDLAVKFLIFFQNYTERRPKGRG